SGDSRSANGFFGAPAFWRKPPSSRSPGSLEAPLRDCGSGAVRQGSGDMTYRFAFRRYDLALRSPVRTAHGLWTQRTGLWLRLESDEGVVGWGEVAPLPWFGTETVDEAEALCRGWGDRVSASQLEAVPVRYGC